MTAAHSFNSKPDISVIYLLVGDHDTSLGTDTPYAALYQAMSVIRHELYVPDSNDQSNDIALIQTVEAIKWKRTIGPACLPFIYEGYNDYFNGYAIVAAGFGATEFAGPSSNVLKKVSLTVVSNDECNNTYGNINSGQICTFTKNADTCQVIYWNLIQIFLELNICASIFFREIPAEVFIGHTTTDNTQLELLAMEQLVLVIHRQSIHASLII